MEQSTQAPLGHATAFSGTTATEPITLNALIDLYLANYSGRDNTRHYRVG